MENNLENKYKKGYGNDCNSKCNSSMGSNNSSGNINRSSAIDSNRSSDSDSRSNSNRSNKGSGSNNYHSSCDSNSGSSSTNSNSGNNSNSPNSSCGSNRNNNVGGSGCDGCSSNCSNDIDNLGSENPDRKSQDNNQAKGRTNPDLDKFKCETHELNNIKRTVAVLSGKGGVGKSLVTSLLAVMMRRKGLKVGVLDADITGPSIPKIFGADDARADVGEFGIYPVRTHNDIKIMSINLMLEKTDTPIIWRGPLIASAVKQFWTDVIWGNLEYLFLDMPPGTGDVPLTVFQSFPLDGIIIVTSPQDLVSLIVKKAYNMAMSLNVPIIGVIENMSYAQCPGCGKKINVFGDSKAEQVASEMNIPFLGRIPIDPELAELCDRGEIEKFSKDYMDRAIEILEKTI